MPVAWLLAASAVLTMGSECGPWGRPLPQQVSALPPTVPWPGPTCRGSGSLGPHLRWIEAREAGTKARESQPQRTCPMRVGCHCGSVGAFACVLPRLNARARAFAQGADGRARARATVQTRIREAKLPAHRGASVCRSRRRRHEAWLPRACRRQLQHRLRLAGCPACWDPCMFEAAAKPQPSLSCI